MSTPNFLYAGIAAVVAGILIASQISMEARIKTTTDVSVVQIGVMAFGTALIILLIYCLFFQVSPIPTNTQFKLAWLPFLLGGVFRIAYLALFLYACKQSDNAYATSLIVGTQVLSAAFIANQGLLGVPPVEWTLSKTIGILMIAAGAYFVTFKKAPITGNNIQNETGRTENIAPRRDNLHGQRMMQGWWR